MNNLLVLVAYNTVVALVFAIFVHGLTRLWRNPPVAHALWLLVLLKLVVPPVVHLDWIALPAVGSTDAHSSSSAEDSRIAVPNSEIHARLVEPSEARTTAQAQAVSVKEQGIAATIPSFWNRGGPVLLWLWLGGAIGCALLAATRIVRFERLLRGTLPASERLQRLALEIAGKLGVRRVPAVRYVECVEVPLLWYAGHRATIVLPMRLLSQLDDQSSALILAHELAHLRRHDHWLRGLELIVATVYWWHPLVWVIRRQIHQSEELCCDAWVRWAFPDCIKRYAQILLHAAESLNASPKGARLLPASPFLDSLSLNARIEMILESRFAPCVSTRSRFVIALLAFLVLPWFVLTTKTEAWTGSPDDAPAASVQKPDARATSEFPYVVIFDQGATRFLNGDKIKIVEVRGTADTFKPKNRYRIKGSYTLASHDRATLAAYVTAMDAENGAGPSLEVQSTAVDHGDGTFTLVLPMSYRGWPHVSFYPLGGGSDFGGSYFGTGASVLENDEQEHLIQEEFKKDPEVIALSKEIAAADEQHQHAKSLARQPDDPARRAAKARRDELWNRYEELWKVRYTAIAKQWRGSRETHRKLANAPTRSDDDAPAAPARKPDTEAASEFPYAVRFEQGATRFSSGDKIKMVEVRGTADTFKPGNLYWIKGTYTLASRDRAKLAAFITAMDAENGKGPYLEVQTTVVKEGSGTFTLFLPMSHRGWPHVSFYPAGGGSDFGGNYFGTGDSVLKQWWGSKETD
jgi:beta-lactamase regulating signal transducer with metallopeptidase domain